MNQICRFTYIIAFFISLNITSFVSSECNGGSPQKVEDFKVKGLYLGMDIEDARKIFKEGNYYLVGDVKKKFWGDRGDLVFEVRVDDLSAKSRVYAHKDKKVYKINLTPGMVDKLFNVEGVDIDTYLKAFMKHYGIPKMTPDPTGNAWEYTFPIGIYIVISPDKETHIKKVKKVPASSEFTFD
jgi:hypothetical protein